MLETLKTLAENRDLFFLLCGAGLALGLSILFSGLAEWFCCCRKKKKKFPFER